MPCILSLIPSGCIKDTGYQGYQPDGVVVFQPIKKPKGRKLTKEEKKYNRKISSFRVRVEHAIGSVKRMRNVKDECNRAANFVHRIFRICAAMHNFRIKLIRDITKTNLHKVQYIRVPSSNSISI